MKLSGLSHSVGPGGSAAPRIEIRFRWEYKTPKDAKQAHYRPWPLAPHSKYIWPRDYIEDMLLLAANAERERAGAAGWMALGQATRRKRLLEAMGTTLKAIASGPTKGALRHLLKSATNLGCADGRIHGPKSDSSRHYVATIKVWFRDPDVRPA